jgi:hypothetical protein
MLARSDLLSHILEFLILLRVGGQFAGVQADSNLSFLSGLVPLRVGQPVCGKPHGTPKASFSRRDQCFESISLQRRVDEPIRPFVEADAPQVRALGTSET